MRHKGDLHSWQLVIEVLQSEELQSFVHARVSIERFDIARRDKELLETMGVSSGNLSQC